MSQEVRQTELREQTQQLLEGPLKHIRAAALAAALLPLASIAAAPAAAQDCQPSSAGTVCGFVWSDTLANGIQDPGESGIPGVTVTLETTNGSFTYLTAGDGFYYFDDVGLMGVVTAQVIIQIPDGTIASTTTGGDEATDSDGVPDAMNTNSVATVPVVTGQVSDADFGFTPADVISDGVTPSPCDFVTSGGFVIKDGKKITFGIHGGCKHGEFWGHLNVVDHATGYHINSTVITGYLMPTGAPLYTREICGLATTNRATDPPNIRFRVRLIDNGEPGRFDLFGLRLEDLNGPGSGYHVSTRLLSDIKPGGGNIQLHDPNPSTEAPPSTFQCGGVASPD